MVSENKFKDDECIPKWKELLRKFHSLIQGEPAAETIVTELCELKEEAKKSNVLTGHQISAIIARCDNYLNGTYGRTKTHEQLASTK
jgi:pyruvate/oxaloacetate carboxyltransferase